MIINLILAVIFAATSVVNFHMGNTGRFTIDTVLGVMNLYIYVSIRENRRNEIKIPRKP